MDVKIATYGLQCIGILSEVALIVGILCSRQKRQYAGPGLYIASLLSCELVRLCAWRTYGSASPEYFYAYWTTDFLLVISAFLLVCLFFQRACAKTQEMWRLVRLLLVFVFILVVGISCLSLSRNYNHLFSHFIFEFNQNLYFACLVLNTLLYILLQQIDSADDELGLLVCGVGIQFAGPTATLALLSLPMNRHFAQSLMAYMMPFCEVGMLLVWGYAIWRVKETKTATEFGPHGAPVLAEVAAHLNG